jgi:hypothetical protein
MLRDRLVMAFALLLLGSLVLTAVPEHAAAASSSEPLLTENAEEATFDEWNARWERFDLNNDVASGQDWWCRSAHNLHGSDHAIYASRNGFNSHYQIPVIMADGSTSYTQGWNVNVTGLAGTTPQSQWVQRYDTNQDAIMRKAVVGASEYNVVTLTFWFWSDTGHSDAVQPMGGSSVGFDFLNVLYWTNEGGTEVKHVAWTDSYEQATAKTWTYMSVDIPNNVTRIGFEFVSGTTAPDNGDAANDYASSGVRIVNGGMREGVYLDDIVLTGSDASSDPVPVDTSVDNLATVQSSRTFNVGYIHNDPTVPFDHVNLYYRQGSSGDWLKYGGDFTSDTIPFTATSDGRYEFFTQGFDANGGSEAIAYSADAATMVDTTAPVTSISVTGTSVGTDAYSGSASFTLTAADGGSGTNSTYYRVDASSWIRYGGSPVTISNGGTHLIQYYSDDIAGNAEQVKSKSISVETTNPVVTFLEPSKTYTTSSATVRFQVTAGSDITELRASLDGESNFTVNPSLTSVTLTNLTSGTHRVTIWAKDSEGRWGQNMTAFSVDLSSPTNSNDSIDSGMILVLGSVSSSYKVGGAVHITWTCTIDSGDIAKYLIKVDDNLVTQLGPEATSYDLKDLKAGSHVVTVIAVDDTDHTTEQSVNVLVKDNGTGTGGISQDVLIIGGIALFAVVAAVVLIYMRSRRIY